MGRARLQVGYYRLSIYQQLFYHSNITVVFFYVAHKTMLLNKWQFLYLTT